jgi:hypothetical protein
VKAPAVRPPWVQGCIRPRRDWGQAGAISTRPSSPNKEQPCPGRLSLRISSVHLSYLVFQTRFVPGDSRRPQLRCSKVRNVFVPHLSTRKEDGDAGAPEPRQIETE